MDEEDLVALRDAIVTSLSLIPPYALVGLITFGTMVNMSNVTQSNVLTPAKRHNYTSLAIKNARNHMFSAEQRNILQSKFPRCLV
jgi:hypothetical protein